MDCEGSFSLLPVLASTEVEDGVILHVAQVQGQASTLC